MIPVSLLAFLRERSAAVIVEGMPVSSVDVDSVVNDHSRGIELALQHLTGLGHKRIAFAAGEPELMIEQWTADFRRFHTYMNLPADADPVVAENARPGESAATHMEHALTELIGQRGTLPFTALLVWGYASAVGALAALDAAGLNIPADVSLVVLDNPDLHGRHAERLTMIGRTSKRISRFLIERLEWRWNNPEARYRVVLDTPTLVERCTTAPPPTRG
jgi:LacI family transcriptional regulator